MKCDFCGRENIRLIFEGVNTDIQIYQCACGHKKTVRGEVENDGKN